MASSVGTTSAALTIPYTDASLSTAGYTYVVKGPNGSTYSTLSSAVAANSIYDATNNSAATDSSAQVFTVSYIGQTQSAVIKYDPNGPLSAGTTFASTSGATNTSISFATNDGGWSERDTLIPLPMLDQTSLTQWLTQPCHRHWLRTHDMTVRHMLAQLILLHKHLL